MPASGEADIEGYFKVLKNGRLDPSSLFLFLVRITIKLCTRNKIGQPLLYEIGSEGYDDLLNM